MSKYSTLLTAPEYENDTKTQSVILNYNDTKGITNSNGGTYDNGGVFLCPPGEYVTQMMTSSSDDDNTWVSNILMTCSGDDKNFTRMWQPYEKPSGTTDGQQSAYQQNGFSSYPMTTSDPGSSMSVNTQACPSGQVLIGIPSATTSFNGYTHITSINLLCDYPPDFCQNPDNASMPYCKSQSGSMNKYAIYFVIFLVIIFIVVYIVKKNRREQSLTYQTR